MDIKEEENKLLLQTHEQYSLNHTVVALKCVSWDERTKSNVFFQILLGDSRHFITVSPLKRAKISFQKIKMIKRKKNTSIKFST